MNSIHNKSWILNNAVNPAQNKIVTWQDLKDNKFVSALDGSDNPSQCLSASDISRARLSLYSHHNNNELVRYGHVIKSPYGSMWVHIIAGAYRKFSGSGTDNRLTIKIYVDDDSPKTNFMVNIIGVKIIRGVNGSLPVTIPINPTKVDKENKVSLIIKPEYTVNTSDGSAICNLVLDPNGERTKVYQGYQLNYQVNA